MSSSDFVLRRPQTDLDVKVFRADISDDDATVFSIRVSAPDGVQWTLAKRYSQLRTFHNALRYYATALPEFPPRKFIGNKDPDFVEKRRLQLNKYFDSLLHSELRNLPFVHWFLHGELRSPSVPEMLAKQMEKLDVLCETLSSTVLATKKRLTLGYMMKFLGPTVLRHYAASVDRAVAAVVQRADARTTAERRDEVPRMARELDKKQTRLNQDVAGLQQAAKQDGGDDQGRSVRASRMDALLRSEVVDCSALMELAFGGVRAKDRGVVWPLLLGGMQFASLENGSPAALLRHRLQYAEMVATRFTVGRDQDVYERIAAGVIRSLNDTTYRGKENMEIAVARLTYMWLTACPELELLVGGGRIALLFLCAVLESPTVYSSTPSSPFSPLSESRSRAGMSRNESRQSASRQDGGRGAPHTTKQAQRAGEEASSYEEYDEASDGYHSPTAARNDEDGAGGEESDGYHSPTASKHVPGPLAAESLRRRKDLNQSVGGISEAGFSDDEGSSHVPVASAGKLVFALPARPQERRHRRREARGKGGVPRRSGLVVETRGVSDRAGVNAEAISEDSSSCGSPTRSSRAVNGTATLGHREDDGGPPPGGPDHGLAGADGDKAVARTDQMLQAVAAQTNEPRDTNGGLDAGAPGPAPPEPAGPSLDARERTRSPNVDVPSGERGAVDGSGDLADRTKAMGEGDRRAEPHLARPMSASLPTLQARAPFATPVAGSWHASEAHDENAWMREEHEFDALSDHGTRAIPGLCDELPAGQLRPPDSSADVSPEAALMRAEADAFWCLSRLAPSLARCLTDGRVGTPEMVKTVTTLLEKMDRPMHAHLDALQVNYSSFVTRWFDALVIGYSPRVWDSLLSDGEPMSLLPYMCTALAMERSAEVQRMSADDAIRTLQEPLPPSSDEGRYASLLGNAWMAKNLYASSLR